MCGLVKPAGPRLNRSPTEIAPDLGKVPQSLVLLACKTLLSLEIQPPQKPQGRSEAVRLTFTGQDTGACVSLRLKLKTQLSRNCTCMCPLPTVLTPALAM